MSQNCKSQKQKGGKNGKIQQKGSNKKQLSCQICLCKMQQNEMMDVCQCKGSSGVLHKQCLVEWIEQSKKYYRSGSKYYFDCDVCKFPMQLQQSLRVRFCQSTHQCNTKYIIFIILMVFLIVVSILLIILPIVEIADNLDSTTRNALLIIGIATLVIQIFLLLIYHLVIISSKIVGIRKINLQLNNSNAKATKLQTQQTNPETIQKIYCINDML